MQPDAWFPAQHGTGFTDIGNVAKNIRRMGRGVMAVGFFTEELLDQFDDLVDAHYFMPTQVEDLVANVFQRQQGASGDIVHR